MSREFRRISPACAARSFTSFCSTGETFSLGGLVRLSAPRISPWCRTGRASVSSANAGRLSPENALGAVFAPFVLTERSLHSLRRAESLRKQAVNNVGENNI
jgi:hypothetical protein